MLDLRTIDDLTRKLGESLPPGVARKKDELERRFRAVLTGAFERMNLVGREEFDAKCKQLEETRAGLRALEERLNELEAN
jgi:BMFP domain-containing protein YqiC